MSESAFLTEVAEHPAALRNLIQFYSGEGRTLLAQWKRLAGESASVVFSGMGTSEFAAQMIIAELAAAGINALTIDAGELLHYPRPVNGMLILISQSGESIETRTIADKMNGSVIVGAITNNGNSTIARIAEPVFLMCAGNEAAITTKTYVNTLAVLFLMADRGDEESALNRLRELSDSISEYDMDAIDRAAAGISDTEAIHFVSRGPAVVAAKQASLTFMEGARIAAAAFTGGAFRHGPFETVGKEHRCVFFIPGGNTFHLLRDMALEISEKGSRVVIITDQDADNFSDSVHVLKVPEFGEDLFCLCAAPTQELLLHAVAGHRGISAGEFRYGNKITVRE